MKPTAQCAVVAAILAVLGTFSVPAWSANGLIESAVVTSTLVTNDDRWGGCMAKLSVDPQTKLAACERQWVTFSCAGTFGDRASAFRMFDQAILAQATKAAVKVYFTDSQIHNGYCLAYRIDQVTPP